MFYEDLLLYRNVYRSINSSIDNDINYNNPTIYIINNNLHNPSF